MARHIQLGRKGEDLAEGFLITKGHTILHRNWRYSRYEIDIITLLGAVTHFTEVKYRTNHDFGQPEESVNRRKLQHLMKAADFYLYFHKEIRHIQFNILSITANAEKDPSYFFIEDVYM
ncbi:MAG TPA: YraN family protein [Flavisolibacter sp.]|jgi:putative endonuclease|nr:YraN family protein [Flavisolibacter sp.]